MIWFVDNYEQCGQHNIAASCFHQPWTSCVLYTYLQMTQYQMVRVPVVTCLVLLHPVCGRYYEKAMKNPLKIIAKISCLWRPNTYPWNDNSNRRDVFFNTKMSMILEEAFTRNTIFLFITDYHWFLTNGSKRKILIYLLSLILFFNVYTVINSCRNLELYFLKHLKDEKIWKNVFIICSSEQETQNLSWKWL
jgi:hypothetical protein